MVPVGAYLGLSAILFAIGLVGFLSRRNIILMLVSLEIMLNAVNVNFAAFGHYMLEERGQILASLRHCRGGRRSRNRSGIGHCVESQQAWHQH